MVNVGQLENIFSNNDSVNPSILISKGILEKKSGKNPKVKILASGELSKKLNISNCKVSAEAKAKIEKVGVTVKSINGDKWGQPPFFLRNTFT